MVGPDPRLFRRLILETHFKQRRGERARYALTAGAFKYPGKILDDGRHEVSLFLESDQHSLEFERAAVAALGTSYGVGTVTVADVAAVGAELIHKPELGDESHYALVLTSVQALSLARICRVVDWPPQIATLGPTLIES